MLPPLLNSEDLCGLQDQEDLVLIHAGSGESTYKNCLKKHLRSTQFVDLNTDLSNIKEDAADGGRHPLPEVQEFASLIARLGIDSHSHVIVYDENDGANAAARFWWMLKALGHNNVQVLDGGPEKAELAGFPTDANRPIKKSVKPYTTEKWLLPTITLEEVYKISESQGALIIDVREPERYKGITEPIDLVAGHIPGAINMPYHQNLQINGKFKMATELKKMYQEFAADNTIVHCGSGVTACHTLLSFAVAGLALPKLYVGSWSEWSRNNKPISTLTDTKKTF